MRKEKYTANIRWQQGIGIRFHWKEKSLKKPITLLSPILDQIITCNVIVAVPFHFPSASVYHALIWQNSHVTNILFTRHSSSTVKNPLKRKITLIYSKYRDRHESPATAFSRLFQDMRFYRTSCYHSIGNAYFIKNCADLWLHSLIKYITHQKGYGYQ